MLATILWFFLAVSLETTDARHKYDYREGSQRIERPPETIEGENITDGLPAIGSKWLSVAAASAILFIGVGYTNTFGVFQDYYQTTLLPDESPLNIITIGSVAV
jgi:hypothetical protein